MRRKERTPDQLAETNLRRVVKAVHGKVVDYGNVIEFRAGKFSFRVWANIIEARRSGRLLGTTCYGVYCGSYPPAAERVASAVLALRNNPRLFMFWKKHPGKFRI